MSSLCRGAVRLALLLLFASPLMAETPSPTPNTGIEGVVHVSPAQGGPIRQGAPSSAPVANVTFAVQKGDETVASFTTDNEGRFHVSLPPGRYTITRSNYSARIGGWRFEAEVIAGEVTKVQWMADSGMR